MPFRPTQRAVLVTLLALALGPSLAAADDPPATESATAAVPALGYQEQVQRFFADLGEGQYGRAIEMLYQSNAWMKPDDLDQAKAQFESLRDVLGEFHGQELLSEQHISDRYVYLWYLGYFDRSPVSLYLKFYKPVDTWRFYSFEYKEDLGQLAHGLAMDQLKASSADSDDSGG